jgi:hypothetical protein
LAVCDAQFSRFCGDAQYKKMFYKCLFLLIYLVRIAAVGRNTAKRTHGGLCLTDCFYSTISIGV